MERLRVTSPVDGSLAYSGTFALDAAVNAALNHAEAAARVWAYSTVNERIATAERLAAEVSARTGPLATGVTRHIGRPLAQADETPGFSYLGAFYSSELAGRMAELALPSDDLERRSVRRMPYGVTLSICAWNYPVAMAAGLILAPILAGNVVIFKHSPQAAGVADLLADAVAAADLPAGLVQLLHLTNDQVGRLLGSRRVPQLNFVGSEAGGRAVRRAASTSFVAENLELGGKDPAYVRADADLPFAAAELVWATFGNSGQSCCSVERIYVDGSVHDRFVDAFKAAADALTVGDPRGEVRLGPVVSAAAAGRIKAQVDAAIRSGARDVARVRPELTDLPGGAYLAPRVLVDVDQGMTVMREELFGPVARIMRVSGDEEAVELMNDSRLGLTASVWSADVERAAALCRRVEAGTHTSTAPTTSTITSPGVE